MTHLDYKLLQIERDLVCCSLQTESDYTLFGNEIKISGSIYCKLTPYHKRHKMPEVVISQFEKLPAELWCNIGGKEQHVLLNSLVDKKILLNRKNVTSSEDAYSLIDSIKFEDCLKLFERIEIPVNLNKADSVELILPDSYKQDDQIFSLFAYPTYRGFFINDKVVSSITERHLLWACCDEIPIRDYELDKNCCYVKSKKQDGVYYRINPENRDNIDKRLEYIKSVLSDWYSYDAYVDNSGSFNNKSDTLKYLLIENGYIGVDHKNLKNLSEGKKPRVFRYADALNISEQRNQKINIGKSQYKFYDSNLKDSLVVGYSESYIEDCLKRLTNKK